ncbi:MAG: cyaA 2 [Verrucomicrobia bacterium]|nr:cyaA 2 [Verrucomicrobiota bacterium]
MLLSLLFVTLGVTYVLVSHANLSNALAHSEANLKIGERIYDDAVRQQITSLAKSAGVMTSDYAIRTVLGEDKPDTKTLSSALKSFTGRVGAPVIALFDTEGALLANSDSDMANENLGPFRYLIERATKADQLEDSGFSYLNGKLHVLVVVPLYAPYPNISGWFGLAFPIDRAFAQKIKDTTGIEVSFVSVQGAKASATTLSDENFKVISSLVAAQPNAVEHTKIVQLGDDRYVSLFKLQDLLGEDPVTVVLERPLTAELAAAHALERRLLYISLAALLVATLIALGLARSISEPVQQLASHTRVIASGDYTARLDLDRADELGDLAESFNAMSIGLAERDQVRDLLDKNVSPEVAAQLMRDGATLGGEEREVTILFADLRGFTTLSEKLPPPALLALLNRYLDRMSGEIERHGGVIDKFIGDAIMALFGAPVAQNDAADRALAAALAMERALADLNAEFAAEGRPPLAIGVGVNTARVVAGNIGSHRRLNYSVIGDGVNVAARLQSLTRTPEYHTNIITSAATLAAVRGTPVNTRPLGSVTVKGRAGAVEIHAVEK